MFGTPLNDKYPHFKFKFTYTTTAIRRLGEWRVCGDETVREFEEKDCADNINIYRQKLKLTNFVSEIFQKKYFLQVS